MKPKKGVAKFLHSQRLFWGSGGGQTSGKSAASIYLGVNCKCPAGSLPCLTAASLILALRYRLAFKIDRYRSAMYLKIRK